MYFSVFLVVRPPDVLCLLPSTVSKWRGLRELVKLHQHEPRRYRRQSEHRNHHNVIYQAKKFGIVERNLTCSVAGADVREGEHMDHNRHESSPKMQNHAKPADNAWLTNSKTLKRLLTGLCIFLRYGQTFGNVLET